jgi:hypothetical protein
MMNSAGLILFALLFSACASRVVVDPRGCEGQGSWFHHEDKSFDYERYYDLFSVEELRKKFDFVIVKNVKTSLGFLREERVYLKSLLESKDIRCYEVQSISYSFHNQPKDVFFSFIPLLGRKTVYVFGNFWEKRSVMEDEELGP